MYIKEAIFIAAKIATTIFVLVVRKQETAFISKEIVGYGREGLWAFPPPKAYTSGTITIIHRLNFTCITFPFRCIIILIA